MFGCLTCRMICNSRFCLLDLWPIRFAYLEPLILQHSFYRRIFIRIDELRLKDNAKRAATYNLAGGVCHFSQFPGLSIVYLLSHGLSSDQECLALTLKGSRAIDIEAPVDMVVVLELGRP